MSSNNIKKVYDALKSSGYTDMGSLEEFTSSMSDNNNRKLVYDALSQEGYSNLGDFDAFSNRMSGSVSEPTPDTTEVAESTNVAKQEIYEPIPVSATDDTTIRGFVPAFEQSADQLGAGIKYAVGEYAEKSSDYENAYNRMSELIDDGVDFSNFDVDKQVNEHKKRDYYKQLSEWKAEIAKREEERKGMRGMDALKHRWNDPKRPTDPFDRRALATAERYTQEGIDKELDTKRTYTLIEQALKDADGDVEKAKALLDERRKQQTWGERMQEEAKQTFSDARPTEGFGAWLGNLAPQMVGNTLAVAAMTNPYTRWLARPLGMANMAALTASSGGSSAYEARKYGEEKGVEIDDATARRAGLLSAGIEAATEYIPFENYYNVASAYTKKKLGNIINRDLVSSPRAQGELAKLMERASKELGGTLINGKNIKEWVVDAGLEGLSEFMAEGGGALIPMIYQNEKDYPTLKSILINGWEGAKAGMFMGAFLGGSSRVVNHYANRDRRKKAGHVDLAETTDGKIVEVLGFTGDDYSVMLPDGGVKHLKREELGDIVSIPFNEFDKETISAETISAYEEGKSAEINQYYNVNVSAEEAFAVIEEKYPDMAEQAKSWVDASPSEVQRYLNDLPEDERVDIGAYLAAEMKRKGVIDGVKERTEAEVESFSQQLEDKTDVNGNVSTATYHEQQVFVKNVQGDNAVIMLDGKPTIVNSKDLSDIATQNVDEVVAEYSEQVSTKAAQETDFALNNHPKTHVLAMGETMNDVDGKTYKVVQINGSEGFLPEQMLYGVVECVYDDKTGMVQPKNGADVMQITYNDMLSIQNDYYNSLDAKESQQVVSNNMSENETENDGMSTEQIEQSVSEEVTDGQNAETQPTKTESVAPAAPQTARERVPKDEKGNPIYEQTDADTAWDAIVEETGGDTEMAQRVAADMLEDKKAALAKLQNGKPKKGATVAEKIANEKAHAAAIAQAQNDVAQWEAIVGTEARRREAAMSEADRYAAEMEQKNISEGLAALGEPQSLEEYVLAHLAGGSYKLRWSDKENGTKGFGSHTGLSTEEMKARLSMIDNKNGLTPEEIAHSIVENMDASFGEVDVMDVTNMVIDAVSTHASRRAMLNGMVESRAELIRQQEIAEQEAKDAWYMEQYHATEEELAAYNEYLAEFAEEIYGEDTDYEQRIATFAEIQLEYDNQGTDADLRSSADQGEGLTSDREGGRSVGEREQLNQREVLGDAAGVAASEDQGAGSSVFAQSDDRAARIAGYRSLSDAIAAEGAGNLTDEEIDDIIGREHEDDDRLEREGPVYTEERLDNGDVRITGTRSNGEVASVSIERDGNVISVDTYEDGALFERTDYDANGNATKVTRYKDGEVVSEQEYKDGKRKVTANYFEMAEEAQKNRKAKKKKDDTARRSIQKSSAEADRVSGEIFGGESLGEGESVSSRGDGGILEEGAGKKKRTAKARRQSDNRQEARDGKVERLSRGIVEDIQRIPLSELEYVKLETDRFFNEREDQSISRKEWELTDEGLDAENSAIDSYPSYIRSLSDSGELQRMFDSASVGEEIQIRRAVEAAGLELDDVVDTSAKRANAKAARDKKRAEKAKKLIESVTINKEKQNGAKEAISESGPRGRRGEKQSKNQGNIRQGKGVVGRQIEEFEQRTGWTRGLSDTERLILEDVRKLTDSEIAALRNEAIESIERGEDVEDIEIVLSLLEKYGRSGERLYILSQSGIIPNQPVLLDKVEQLFMEYNEDEGLAILFDRLLPIIEQVNPKITFEVIRDVDGNVKDSTVGDFYLKDNHLRFNLHSLNSSFQTDQEKANTIVHEMLHAVTQYALDAKQRVNNGEEVGIELSNQLLDAAQSLINIYNSVKGNPILAEEYGIKDVHEMVSELANPEFRDKLKQIKVKGKSAWERIKDAIKRFLNWFGDIYDTSAYSKAMSALDELMDNFDIKAYERSRALDSEAKESRVDNLRSRDDQDAAYMDAVERGDMETAQRMVDEAARKAMKKTKVVDKDKQPMLMSHHTDAEGFYVFDRGKIGTGQGQAFLGAGFNFSRGSGSSVYGSRNIQAYLDARKPLRSDRNTLSIYQIEQIIKELNAINGDNVEYNFADNISRAARAIYEYGGDLDTYASLCTAYSGETRDVLEVFEKLGFDSTIEYGDDKRIMNAVVFNSNQIKSADPVTYDDNGNVIPLSERFNLKEEDIRFRDGAPFFSNAERAVENIKQNKATPEQWLAMIKKDGGLKAGEDKWMGLSDWLNEQKENGVKTLTKDEVLQFIRENQIEIEEVNYEDGVEDARYDAEEAIRENLQELFDMKVDEVRDENPEQIYMSDIYEEAFERVCAEVGYNKDDAPFVYTNATITLRWYPDVTTDELLDLSRRLGFNYSDSLNIPNAEQINSTRLDYTTEGLDNKKEIAFVVPTIESWNRNDEVHFGDAGEGRAVAWVRFGETTDSDGNRVLVIDEVQSKRHDEGRSKGYYDGYEEAEIDKLTEQRKAILEKQYSLTSEYTIRVEDMSEAQRREYEDSEKELQDTERSIVERRKRMNGVPDAPFDKNYHELVMKRMLRYAAENGFDKVAWTKGAQQAKRYGLNKVVDTIDASNFSSDTERDVRLTYTNEQQDNLLVRMSDGVVVKGDINGSSVEGQKLSDIIGKDAADKLLSTTDDIEVKGEGSSFGGEDRNALYDEMIPRFMNKYTKKWGTKVGEVTLPNVEEAGRTMWSVDVNPEMRESVMQGQPMFREGMGAISDREVSYENDPIAKFQGKPRYYGKKAAAFAERERRRMENAAKEAAEMLGIEAEIITDASTLQGRKAKAKGWYDIVNKKVVVVVPNHVSMGDAVRTVLHEGIAHHGLRELFGDGFDAMLDNVYNNVSPELKARIDAIAERTGVSTSVATEEYLASLAETTNFEEAQRSGWWAKIKQYFVKMLDKLGMPELNLKEEITDNELRYLLWRSYKNLVEPNSYLKPLGYLDDVAKQKELKVGNYAEKKPAIPMSAEMSEAEEWAAVTVQRIDELEAQAAQLENEIAEMEADRDADDSSRYDMWEQQIDPLRTQMEDVYAELEGLYSLEAEEEDIEDYEAEREADKQRQLYQKRIDNAYLKAVREGDWEEATDLFRQYVLSKAEDEGIVPMDYGVGYRGGAHSSIAKKVKEENPDAIAETAYQMSIRIPKGSILVPMPSRTGNATYTVKLAEAIAKATDSEVRDVLKGKARMSVYEANQKGIKMTPEDLGMYTTEELPKGKNIVIIDNVIDKGTTALAAVSAVKGASVVAYAYTLGDKQRVASLKLAEPVTYDDNMRIIPLSRRFDKETDDIRYRLVDDQAEIERLESEPTIKAYRAMQVINGELYPPMSAVVDGKLREPIALGQWEQSEERPDLADDNGRFKLDKGNKKSLKAAYNPYFHSSSTPLNDQFSEAQDRDNLVTVEVEVPASEADGTSGYKAEKAKDAVGAHQWKAGIIQGQLTGTREVFLTRWDKPVRIVPESEVADVIVEMFDGKDIVMPSNVVTPQLRKELEARGITFVETDNQGKLVEGEHKGEHYSKVYGKKAEKANTSRSREAELVFEGWYEREELVKSVKDEASALGVTVTIANTVDELPEEARKAVESGRPSKGWYNTENGEVIIYAPHVTSPNDAKRTVLHEIVGHKGLRELIGEKEYDSVMVRLMYLLPSDVRDAVLRRAEKHAWNAAIAMDEYLAEKAEEEVTMPWWGRVNAWMRAMFRKHGFDVKLTDADVKYLLWRSRKKMRGDDAYDMAFDNKLKRAARQSARAEAWVKDNFTWAASGSAMRERTKALSDMANAEYEEAVMSTQAGNMLSGIWYALKNGKKGFKSLRNDMAEAYLDGTRAVAEAQKAIEKKRGRKIRGYEDIHSAHNAKSSKDQREIFQLNDNILQPLSRAVANLINKAGKNFDEFSRYLNAKHGLERNVKFAERDAENESEKLRQNAVRSAEMIAKSRRERAEADYNDAVSNLDALRNEGRVSAVGYAAQSRKLKEQYDNKLAKIDTDLKAAIAQAEEDKKTKREELLKEYRKNDYSGLTAIFTMDNEERTPKLKELEKRAKEYVDAFEASCDKNQLDLVWKLIRIATKFSVEKMYNSSLISKEQRDSMMNNFEYYVPLRGWKDDYTGDVYSYIASGNPEAVQQVIKHAKGRKSEADNILGTIFSMANYAIVLGNKNEVNLKLLNLAYNDPSGLLNVEETWYEETESGELVPLFPDMSDENLTSEQKMQKIEEYRAKVERLKNEGKAKLVRNPFKEGYPLHAKAWQEQQHAVMVKRGGEEFVVWVNGNPKLAQALNGLLHKSQREAEDNMMSNILRWMAATQTSYSPEFWLTNLQRDLITANTGNFIKYGAGYEKEFAKNLASLLPVTSFTGKKDKLSGVGIFKLLYLDNAGKLDMSNPVHKMFKEFADNGGMTGISQITDPLSYEKKMLKEIDKELSGIKSVPTEVVEALGNGVKFINRGFENATRFATYITSRQMGKGVTESIRDAKDVSVNFNMKGSGAWGNAFMRKYFIYFNAAIQGLRTVATWHEASKKRFYGVGGSVIAASVALAIINDLLSGGDDDDENAYYGLSEWNRYNFFNIKIGENSFLHWSLPQEYRPIYALGQIGYDLVSGRITNDRALKSVIIQLNNLSPFKFVEDSKYTNPDGTFLEAIIKGLVPSQIKPLVDAYITNEDFLGRRVHGQTDYNRDLPEYKRVMETTPQFLIEGSRVLSEISGGRENKRGLLDNKFLTNPSITWYLLKAAGGGTITFLGKFANMSKWDEEWTEVPILPKFVATSGDDYSKQRVTNDKYWKYRKGYEEIHKELTRNKNDEDMSKERKKEIEDELKQGKKYEYYKVLKKYESKYKTYRELIEKYEEDGNAEKEQEYRDKMFELKKKIVAEIEGND